MKPFLLLAGDDGALLVPPVLSGSMTPLFAHHDNADQVQALLDAAAAQPKVPIVVLADHLAQEFRCDTFPKVGFTDRHKLMQRRLQNAFSDPLSLTAALPAQKNRALYVCLHTDNSLGDWIKRFEALPNPFHGVCPLPLVGTAFLLKLVPDASKGWCVLLSWQRTGGFRQIALHDGQFVFTRLMPAPPLTSDPKLIKASIAQGLKATRDYLGRFGLTGATPLRVAALLPESLHAEIYRLPSFAQLAAVLTPHQAAQRLGLAFSPRADDPAGDLVFALWAAKQRALRPLLLPAEKKKNLSTSRFQRMGLAAAIVFGLSTLAVIGWQSHDLWRLMRANSAADQSLAELQQEWETERAKLAPVTEPLGRLRQAVARQRLFTAPSSAPWGLLEAVNSALGGTGGLAHIDWQAGKGGATSEVLTFTLRLSPSVARLGRESAPQDVVRDLDQLALRLRHALPDFDVSVARYPFLIQQDETLSNARENKTGYVVPTADFVLRRVKS